MAVVLTMDQTINMSSRGFTAYEKNLKPLMLWTAEELKYEVIKIKLSHKPCPCIRFDSLDDIPFEILAENLLCKREWHHVNFQPHWFYGIDETAVVNMTMDHIRQMMRIADAEREIQNKPRLAVFRIHKWKVSPSGHEFSERSQVIGILYNETAYFDNGRCKRIVKDQCEVKKIFPKVPKTKKTKYDIIRRKMRAYEIYF